MGMPVSDPTVLREPRRAGCLPTSAPVVIGIDDWVLAGGHRYGTIVVTWKNTVRSNCRPGAMRQR